MKRERIDLRDFFRAIANVATESREPAVTVFMKSILFEGTDRDASDSARQGDMLCIPSAAITTVVGPRRCESDSARPKPPRHPNGRGQWKRWRKNYPARWAMGFDSNCAKMRRPRLVSRWHYDRCEDEQQHAAEDAACRPETALKVFCPQSFCLPDNFVDLPFVPVHGCRSLLSRQPRMRQS